MKAYRWLAVCFIVVISVHGCKRGQRHTGGAINEQAGGGSTLSGSTGGGSYVPVGSFDQLQYPREGASSGGGGTTGNGGGTQTGSNTPGARGTSDTGDEIQEESSTGNDPPVRPHLGTQLSGRSPRDSEEQDDNNLENIELASIIATRDDEIKDSTALLSQYHMVIAGGGLQTVALVGQFRKYDIRPPVEKRQLGDERFSILVLEMNDKIGAGFPYSSNVVNLAHITNTMQPLVDAATTAETKQSDFEEWLVENKDDSLLKNDDIYIKRPQRYKVGEYLESRYLTFKAKCKGNGYTIHEKTKAEVTDVQQDGHGFYKVVINGMKHKIAAENIVLATGHYESNRLNKPISPNYHFSPWIKGLLDKFNLENNAVHIGTLGTSLSSIDLALLVVDFCGYFEEQKTTFLRKPKLVYVYKMDGKKQKCKPFKITMYSRSGQLPQVRGFIPRQHQVDHVGEDEILKIANEEGNDGFLPVQRLFDIITNELDKAEKDEKKSDTTITKARGYKQKMNITDWLAFVDNVFYKGKVLSGEEMLRKDIERAEATIKAKPQKAITLQTVLYYSLLFLNLYGKYLSVEDSEFYKGKVESKLYKLALTIPLQNARKMQALVEAGILKLKILVDTCTIVARDDGQPGVQLQYRDSQKDKTNKNMTLDHFVDCRGQTGDIELDERDLTKNMLKSGLIQPLYVRYKDQELGAQFVPKSDVDLCAVEEDRRVYPKVFKNENGVHFRKVAGIVLDLKTFQALPADRDYPIDDDKSGAIYASGPYVYGYYQIAQSLYINVYIAEEVVPHVLKRYGLVDDAMIEEIKGKSAGVILGRSGNW